MTVHRWEGLATAASSIVHGGETLGTVTYLRREAFLTPQGRLNIPVISGNGVRGILRDIGARLTWEALGEPDLPTPVLHALWSGGALVKAKTKPLTGERLAHLRRLVPHIGVFGAAGGGRILDSILDVGKLVPVCAQTAHLVPDHLLAGPPTDMHDLLQIERYSRLPGLGLPTGTFHVADAVPTPTGGLVGNGGETEPSGDSEPDGLMRYGTETFVAGTQFHTWFALRHPTPTELGFFTDVLDTYLAHATVGGKSARGHGHLTYALTRSPEPTAWAHEETDTDGETEGWRGFAGHTSDEVIEALRWLD